MEFMNHDLYLADLPCSCICVGVPSGKLAELATGAALVKDVRNPKVALVHKVITVPQSPILEEWEEEQFVKWEDMMDCIFFQKPLESFNKQGMTLVKSLVVKRFAVLLASLFALILFPRMSWHLDFTLERLIEPWLQLDSTLAWTCKTKRLGLMMPLEKCGSLQLQEISIHFHLDWRIMLVHFHLLSESTRTGTTILCIASFRDACRQSKIVAGTGEGGISWS